MCYIHNALDMKASAEQQCSLNNLYLNRYYGKKTIKFNLNYVLINSKFFRQRKLAKQLSKVIYKDYYLSNDSYNTIFCRV